MQNVHENGRSAQLDESSNVENSFAFWDRLYVLRRRWWVVLLSGIAGIGVANLKLRSVVPVYQAESTVQRKMERSPLEGIASQAPSDMVSELEIFRSSAVLGAVVDSTNRNLTDSAREDSIKSMRRTLNVGQVPGTNLIRITYRHFDPKVAAHVVNKAATAYQAFSVRKAREDAARRREFIEQELGKMSDSVDVAQRMLAEYQRSAGVYNPTDRGSAIYDALIAAEGEVSNLRFQEGVLQTIIAGLRNTNDSNDALRKARVLGRDIVPGLSDLYGRLQQYELERSRLTVGRFGETRQGVNVEVLDSLIAATKEDLRATAEQSLAALRGRIAAASQRMADLQAQQGGLPEKETEFSRLRQRVTTTQGKFNQLTDRYYEAKLGEAVEGGEVEIVDAATVPRQPVESRNPRLLIFALVAGLVAGALMAFFLEFLDSRIRTPRDLEEASRLKMLGGIPRLTHQRGSQSPLIMLTDDTNAASEAFRMLRTALDFARPEKARVIAVTSAGPGEGKSVIASNLAIATARQGLTVLLIDADLRRHTIDSLFDISNVPGLSDVLVGNVPLSDAVNTEQVITLAILPAGTRAPNPSEMLGGQRFDRLIQQARSEYDVVIIDTPPILAVTDAAALVRYVDGVLVVARAEFSQRHAVTQATAALRHVRASLLGVVLNCIPRIGGYGRYGGHYGYYGYTYTEYYKDSREKRPSRFSRV
jgi:polysaccharide biosynthesis transport protein